MDAKRKVLTILNLGLSLSLYRCRQQSLLKDKSPMGEKNPKPQNNSNSNRDPKPKPKKNRQKYQGYVGWRT